MEAMMSLLTLSTDNEKERAYCLLSDSGDDQHNCDVIEECTGELLLIRKNTERFKYNDYVPSVQSSENVWL